MAHGVTDLPKYIERPVSNYLKIQIESGDPTRTKRALQKIAKLYRSGWRILQDQLIGIELATVGLLMSSDDAKVRRWALNTLAQLGHEKTCKNAIIHALKTYHDDAEVLAAAIAALYRLCKNATADLRQMGFNEQTVTLAALQHVPAMKLDLSCLPLRVDRADSELIKLGLIVVGLNRAPPHLFEPNHSNAAMVRAMGGHHDPMVSQYSVWAITENQHLGVADLGIDLKSIEQLPANVRAWVFQLLAIDSADTDAHVEYIRLGIEDQSAEARLGLAVGLQNTFSQTLEPLVLDWFTRELTGEVMLQVLDHLIRQADRSAAYKSHVLAAFERGNADDRDRMLATSAGSPLYSILSKIKYDGGADLFRGATEVTNQTFNIGNIQTNSLAINGNSSQTGSVTNTYNAQTLEAIQSHLTDAEREIRNSAADVGTQKEALRAVEAAKKEPTKDNLGAVVTAIGKVEAMAQRALGVSTALVGIAHLISQASGVAL